MNNIDYKWTDGTNKTFQIFYLITENYYSKMVGGVENRKSFIPYNISASIQEVLIAYIDDVPVACSGLKKYSEEDAVKYLDDMLPVLNINRKNYGMEQVK